VQFHPKLNCIPLPRCFGISLSLVIEMELLSSTNAKSSNAQM
jgi:hypothetical protein